ncbi:MAG: F0F1 ATP synthase subunit epsilon [Mycobacteriaceae bacterium]
MAEVNVEVVAVEERLWSGTASLVVAQTTEGEIGVMAGHEPMLGQLIEGGTVSISSTDGERLVAAVHGGFLSVTSSTVTILAESAQWASDIDLAAAKEALAAADPGSEAAAAARGQIRAVERSSTT